jgi:hypothetical protein
MMIVLLSMDINGSQYPEPRVQPVESLTLAIVLYMMAPQDLEAFFNTITNKRHGVQDDSPVSQVL